MSIKLNVIIDDNGVRIVEQEKELVFWGFDEMKEDKNLYDVIANAIILVKENPEKLKDLLSLKTPIICKI
jgi:hypothetical protein